MTIFITGATGFIGSHCVRVALAQGHQVIALRRKPVPDDRQDPRDGVCWITKPLDELEADDFAGADVLLHLAAHTPNLPYDSVERCFYWNVTASLQAAEKAHKAGVRHFVVAGTCFEYGDSGNRFERIPPDAPLEAILPYPASKAASCIGFRAFAAEHGVSMHYHRIFQVFGEGEPEGRLWPSLRRAALAGSDYELTPGEQIRDFITVSQVAETLIESCEMDARSGNPVKILNLGTGEPLSLRQFAENWWKFWEASGKLLFGVKSYRNGEVMRFVPMITRNTPIHMKPEI